MSSTFTEPDCTDTLSLENKAQLIEYATGMPEGEGVIAAANYVTKTQINCLKVGVTLEELAQSIEMLRKKEGTLIDFFEVNTSKNKWLLLPINEETKKQLWASRQLLLDILGLRYTANPTDYQKLEVLKHEEWDGSHELYIQFWHPKSGQPFIRRMEIREIEKPDLLKDQSEPETDEVWSIETA